MRLSDVTLHTQWCRERNADAFAELVCRHSTMVFSTCLRVLRNASIAEDAAQECFIELMNARRPVSPSVGGWLHTVATRRALDRLRSESSRTAREARYAGETPTVQAAEFNDIAPALDEAISELPTACRYAIVMRFFENKGHRDIASELGVSQATVRRRIQEGIGALRKNLSARGVVVSASALGALLESTPSFALAPGVGAALGKQSLALAMQPPTAATAIGTVLSLSGAKAALVAGVVVLGGLFAVGHITRNDGLPPRPDSTVLAETRPEPAAASSVSESPPVPASPVIKGVVLDLNDSPIPDAKVTVQRREGDSVLEHYETTSLTDGHFEFFDIPVEGKVVVSGSKPGMIWLGAWHKTTRLTGEGIHDATVRLCPAGSISGRAIDTAGQPLAGHDVTLRAHDPAMGAIRRTVQTDSAGYFLLEKLAPGMQHISAVPDSQYRAALVDAELELGPGEQYTNLVLEIPNALSVSGTVVDQDGMPVEGVFVQITGVYGPEPADTRTDQKGTFLLARIPDGEYIMSLTHRDYGHEYAKAVAGDVPKEVILQHNDRLALSGRVVAAETGAPIPVFEIQAAEGLQENLTSAYLSNFRAFNDDSGRFEWSSLKRGTTTLVVRSPGRQMRYYHVDTSVNPIPELVIPIERGPVVSGTAVTTSGVPVPDAYVLLGPFAFDTAHVMNSTPNPNWVEEWYGARAVARSAADGRFTINSLPVELETITAFHPEFGYGSVGMDGGSSATDGLVITLRSGGIVEGRVTVAGEPLAEAWVSIRGDFPFNRGANPGNRTDSNGTYRITHLPAGNWDASVKLMYEGTRTILSQSFGRRYHRAVTVTDGQTTSLDLDVPLFDTQIEGSVQIEASPAAGGEISVESTALSSSESYTAPIQPDGSFQITGLAPGAVSLRIRARLENGSMRAATRALTLSDGEHLIETIDIAGGVTVQGQVLGALQGATRITVTAREGAAATGPMVDEKSVGSIRASSNVEIDGSYSISGLSPGVYAIHVSTYIKDPHNGRMNSHASETMLEILPSDGEVLDLDLATEPYDVLLSLY